ncbi:MAG: hypothetical protein R3E01_13415 [Pirellulaceae bacterium]
MPTSTATYAIRPERHEVPEFGSETQTIPDEQIGYWIKRNTAAQSPNPVGDLSLRFGRLASGRGTTSEDVFGTWTNRDETALLNQQLEDSFRPVLDHAKSVAELLQRREDLVRAFEVPGFSVSDDQTILAIGTQANTAPRLLHAALRRLDSYKELEEGWNGYTAEPPSAEAVSNAREFLKVLFLAGAGPCRVKPSAIGGIGITVRTASRKAYVEFLNDGQVHALLSDEFNEPLISSVNNTYRDFLLLVSKVRAYLNE